MTTRRAPSPSEVWRLLRPTRRPTGSMGGRLARAADIADLRRLAARRVPRAVFDYVDGGAEGEVSLRRARQAFAELEFVPSVLRDVSEVDTARQVLGRRAELPMVFAPTGYTRLMHHEGEPAVARVAGRIGIPYALSTMGTTTAGDLRARVPGTRTWFQLYLWRDREATAALVDHAAESGCEALVLTVDVPVGGNRLRDVRHGLTIPPAPTLRTLADAALRPRWWFDLLTTEPLTFASLTSFGGTVAELTDQLFDPTATVRDLAWLRETWRGPLIVKGVLTPDDARAVVDEGADAVVVSDHGGRQLDPVISPLEQLPSIVDAVGTDAEVYVDGGILRGSDVVAAVALGARACLVGRAYLYGLMAGGQAGVQRAADILSTEIRRTLRLLGVTSLDQLSREHVRRRR